MKMREEEIVGLATGASQKGRVPLVHHDGKVLALDAVAAHVDAATPPGSAGTGEPRRPLAFLGARVRARGLWLLLLLPPL